MSKETKITVEAVADAPVAEVWKAWNTPADIMQWNTADPSWHSPNSENDLRVGGDGRKVTTWFAEKEGKTTIQTTFDAETENEPEFQKQGWQAILNNFVKYVDSTDRR